MKQLFFKRKKDKKNNSVQDWMPITDINNGIIYRKDNCITTVISLKPINLKLLSEEEIKNIIRGLTKTLNGFLLNMQWLTLNKPVDLDSYMSHLESLVKQTLDINKKKLLKSYMKQAVEMALGGAALTKHCYMLLEFESVNSIEYLAKNTSIELCNSLTALGLQAEYCDDQQIIELLFTFNNPIHSSFEKQPNKYDDYLSPILGG
ncbi:hypothetical protein IMX26_13005 [Clostridium sp. 'deep sea']|uniref:hypothetical protein n=1 Tax=Clostridium sp. 'deep sea' TaxID=2779445 RepID=UPI001896A40A|nr:hypothetical protein [Clostridium sp. 'deep sea']QOR34404.1 hypothetical protein IMX26_13005 [Clostridium sp. 'deep sea']